MCPRIPAPARKLACLHYYPLIRPSFASPGTRRVRKNAINPSLICPRSVGAPWVFPEAVCQQTAPAQSSGAQPLSSVGVRAHRTVSASACHASPALLDQPQLRPSHAPHARDLMLNNLLTRAMQVQFCHAGLGCRGSTALASCCISCRHPTP